MIEIAVIIVNYNLTKEVKNLLSSIYNHVNLNNIKIFVVDNSSPDRRIEGLSLIFPFVEFIYLKNNRGFGSANNYVFKNYEANFYLLLNPDSILIDDAICKLIKFIKSHQEAGIVGPMLLNENGTIQESARKFPGIMSELLNLFGLGELFFKIIKRNRHKISTRSYYVTDFVYGSCLLIKNEVLKKIGYFDERFFLFSEETDLCYRVKHETEYKVYYVRDIKVIHLGGKITNANRSNRIKLNLSSQLLFYEKNYSFPRIIILRILNIIKIIIMIIFIPFFAPRGEKKEYFKNFKYLFDLYLNTIIS